MPLAIYKVDSLDEYCLNLYNNRLFGVCMEFAKDSPAPPLDFLAKMTSIMDDYSRYVVNHINNLKEHTRYEH